MTRSISEKNLKCEIETCAGIVVRIGTLISISEKNLKCEIETCP